MVRVFPLVDNGNSSQGPQLMDKLLGNICIYYHVNLKLYKNNMKITKEFGWCSQRVHTWRTCEWFPRIFFPLIMGNGPMPYGYIIMIETLIFLINWYKMSVFLLALLKSCATLIYILINFELVQTLSYIDFQLVIFYTNFDKWSWFAIFFHEWN